MSKKILPGLIDQSVEVFNDENGNVLTIQNGNVLPFSNLPFAMIERFKELMKSDKEVLLAMHDLVPDSEILRIEKFVSCRFGGLDYQGDIVDDKFQDGEYWNCPNRANCPHNGIVCKLPMVNGERITEQDVKILQLTATEMTNDVIAQELNLPLGTLHKLKRNIWATLGIQTKQQATLIANEMNLLP